MTCFNPRTERNTLFNFSFSSWSTDRFALLSHRSTSQLSRSLMTQPLTPIRELWDQSCRDNTSSFQMLALQTRPFTRARKIPAVTRGFFVGEAAGIGLRPSRLSESQGPGRYVVSAGATPGSGARCPRPQSPHVLNNSNSLFSSAGSSSFPVYL